LITNICCGARVQLTGKDFELDWVLFNGTQGTIIGKNCSLRVYTS
jgi:hypothetical protein